MYVSHVGISLHSDILSYWVFYTDDLDDYIIKLFDDL